MLDIVSTRMLGQFGFLARVRRPISVFPFFFLSDNFFVSPDVIVSAVQVFSTFEDLGISVDVVATSEVSISLTLDPSKLWSRELIQQASVGTLNS